MHERLGLDIHAFVASQQGAIQIKYQHPSGQVRPVWDGGLWLLIHDKA